MSDLSAALSPASRRWTNIRLLPVLVATLLVELFAVLAFRLGWNSATGIGLEFWSVIIFAPLVLMLVCSKAAGLVRNRFQFGLKGFLAATLVIGVCLGWIGMSLEKTRRQRTVIGRLEHLGVSAQFRGENEMSWKTLLGREYFDDVVDVRLGTGAARPAITDEDVTMLAELRELRVVTIEGGPNDTFTDAQLLCLAGLPRLERLGILKSNLSGGPPQMRGFSSLQGLSLTWSTLENGEARWLGQLTALTVLNLNRTSIGDAGLVHLVGLAKLEMLYLDGTKVTDQGLAYLGRLTNLQELHLRKTAVTDAGLTHLSNLPKLRQLSLEGTRVTPGAIQKLRQAIPELTIWPKESDKLSEAAFTP